MSNKTVSQGANVRTSCISLRALAANKHNQHTENPRLEPAIRDAQRLAQNVFPPSSLEITALSSIFTPGSPSSSRLAAFCVFVKPTGVYQNGRRHIHDPGVSTGTLRASSLRSKRFQSSYCAKVRAEAKKG